jgi:hypothetical protein
MQPAQIQEHREGWFTMAPWDGHQLDYGPYRTDEIAAHTADWLDRCLAGRFGARLVRLTEIVHDTMLADGLGPSACIAGTAALVDLLRAAGHRVEPQPVTVAAFNRPALDLVAQDRLRDAYPDEWDAEGAWSIGLGFGMDPEPGRWPGHLVAVVDRRWLLDPTLGQGDRTARGLPVPPTLALPVTERWLRYREPVRVATQGGAWLWYEAVRDNPGYRASPDWTDERRRLARVAAALRLAVPEEDARVPTA